LKPPVNLAAVYQPLLADQAASGAMESLAE
jgi:hypothetical protein